MPTTSGNNTGSIQLTTVPNTTSVVDTFVLKDTTAYARPKTIAFVAEGLKPNTKYWPFFDDIFVGQFCVPGITGATGPAVVPSTADVNKYLISDSYGDINGLFFLPARTFATGTHTFKLVDNYQIINSVINANPSYAAVEATYQVKGVLKQQQTIITGSTTDPVNIPPVVVPDTVVQGATTAIALPTAQICETWYFEYTITSTKQEFFTQTTNSATPPSIASVSPTAGMAATDTATTITYISTETIGSGKYDHKYRSSRTNETRVLRQEWVGVKQATDAATLATLPSLTSFRPTGIGTNDIVTIKKGWTKIGPTACPVNLGAKTPKRVDPLAQSFFIDPAIYPDGLFTTAIAVYFKNVDQSTPVQLELRNMSNGLPGSNVLPNGSVLVPGYGAASSKDATIATVFRFEQPIYLRPSTDYCFVLKSSSMGYNAWCSRIGQIDIISGKIIDTQPFSGTLFKSENDVTWTPDQYEDIKFDLFKASFDTAKTGQLLFWPQKNSLGATGLYYSSGRTLPLSYISTTSGLATVKVRLPGHGLKVGDYIFIEGVGSSSLNGLTAAAITGQFAVTTVVDEDTIQFNASTGTATISGDIKVPESTALYDTAPASVPSRPTIQTAIKYVESGNISPSTVPGATGNNRTFPTTSTVTIPNMFTVYSNVVVNELMIDYLGSLTDGYHTDIEETVQTTSYTGSYSSGSFSKGPFITLERNGDFYSAGSTGPFYILTPNNELKRSSELLYGLYSSNTKSMQVQLNLTSSNKDVSPVVDTTGMTLMTKTYKIDNQSAEWDGVYSIPWGGATGVLENNTGYVIKTLGTATWSSYGYDGATGVVGGSFVANLGATGALSINGAVYKNSEILAGTGKAAAKYKSVVNTLSSPYNRLSVYVIGTCPSPAVFDVYVRTSADPATHMDQEWTWAKPAGATDTTMFTFTNTTDDKTTREWSYEYTTTNLFTVFDVKIVMRSTNSSIVPKIYNVRTIANLDE